ncbi:hypothetical protein, partial [Herbaspirillum rubrisubalbicans]|uniref:hypothetical protein n=1 Tax=Herbaspirillum rubrisubalbicans TaxID=80842 RepID=UPI001ED9AB0F
MSQQHVKEISWFTFSITCIGFFVVGSWICSFCRLEALRAGCQASRGVRLRSLCPSGHQHQTMGFPLNGTGPDDPAPGSKDLNSASFMMTLVLQDQSSFYGISHRGNAI